ncbi:flagellin [Succinivibrio faecicola]|uniref:Flagellin n=1 Tax=Succinivibrio faecicola TaxID=2820300 RepID=A0ABS7DFW3_9GAMM|nr:flagellin [Succinivibrio faecicola]MBW7570190.1 flagellin [Succinivibrio faecicola]
MALYVSTNISSINSGRQLGKATHALDTSYKRLSSGLRINSAKDDAAGLQISNRLTAQINGLNQGNRNANDGIALAQTAEGALDEVTNMLQRIRTLALQSANGTNTTTDRTSLQSEVTQLSSEIARIACKTTFAGNSILAGAGKGLLDSKGKLSLQVGANANDTVTVNLSVAFLLSKMQEVSSVSTKGLSTDKKSFDVSTVCKAQNVLEGIDSYISFVDKKRGELGAVQNRLESTIANQSNIAENESDARSRIRDTDYAEEAANLSQQTIVQQAASSMLTQANSRPQIALSLLG